MRDICNESGVRTGPGQRRPRVGPIINKFMDFTVCSQVVNHNNERQRTESWALWGMLPRSVFQEETQLPTLTHWHRWQRYDANHLSRQWLILKFLSLVNKMLWLTMSKAFLRAKFMNDWNFFVREVGCHLRLNRVNSRSGRAQYRKHYRGCYDY